MAVLTGAGLRGRRRAGLAVTFGVLLLSAFGLAAGIAVSGHGEARIDQLAARTHVADVVAWAHPAGPAGTTPVLPGIAAQPGVRAAVGPFPTTEAQYADGSHSIQMQVTGVDDPRIAVNRPLLAGGRWVRGPAEIVLERSLAESLGLRPGSRVAFQGTAGAADYTVVGTAYDLTDCTYPQCNEGRTFATAAGVERLDTAPSGTYWLAVAGSSEAVADHLLSHYGSALDGVNTWPDTRGDLTRAEGIFGRFVSVFGGFLLVACAIVVAGSMATRMVERRREIGLYGAIGFTRGQIVGALIAEELVVGVAASLGGWAVAGALVPFLTPGGAPLGRPDPAWPLAGLVATVVIVSVVLVLSILAGAWRTGRRAVPELLADAPPIPRGRFGRAGARVPRALALLGLGAAVARPVRALLAALAVGVAVVGAVVGFGFVTTISQAFTQPARTGDPWTIGISPRTTSVADGRTVTAALGADPDVASWYTETDRPASLQNETFRARAIGGSPRYVLGAGRMPAAPGEVIIGYGMVHDFGLAVGSTAPMRIDGRPFTGRVVGWYRETEDNGDIVALRLADLHTLEPGAVPDAYRVTTAPGVTTAAGVAGLRSRLASVADVDQIDDSPNGGISVLRVSIGLIVGLLGIVALANLMAALLTGNAEQTRVTGVEQALGFTPRQLIWQGVVAAAGTGFVAVVLGLPLGLVAFRALSNLVTSGIGAGPDFAALPGAGPLVVIALVAPLLCGLLGAEAARRALRIPAAECLRWE
ncbi:MAG: ABC transporter permease [Frankia sp.]